MLPVYNFHYFLLSAVKMRKPSHASNTSKAIQDFNRQCAEQTLKRVPNHQPKKYEKRIQNYGIDMGTKIGEGTFSKVFSGVDLVQERQVAVKIVQLRKIQEMGIEQLFWQELNIVKRLKHPNIVSCIQYFRTANNCYSIYELCEDGDLAKRIRKGHLGDKDDVNEANTIIKDVFQGLLYLESLSIVHRDIKAANILLSKGKAKIGDFGFATHCKREFKDVSIGSPAYMAPEGLISNVYGPKTDVWAFGMLLFEMLHGQTPFSNCQSQAQLKQKVQIPVNWDHLKGSLPSPLKRLILKCLKVDYQQRPTFSQLLNDQYIQKIYQDSTTFRHTSKSNYTKLTSDSENTSPININKCRERKSIASYHHRFVSEVGNDETMERRENVKTEPNQEEEDSYVIPELLESTNFIEANYADRYQQKTEREEKKEEKVSCFAGITLENYHILTQNAYSSEQLSSYLKVGEIFKETVKTLSKIPQQPSYSLFLQLTNQILLQVYTKATKLGLSDITSKTETLIQADSKLDADSFMSSHTEFPTSQIDEQLFQLIKLIETTIDKLDMDRTPQALRDRTTLILTGNLLIISLHLSSNLHNNETRSLWLANSTNKLGESDQFYMWLYQLQLQRMQLD